MTEEPQWALNEAAKRVNWSSWEDARKNSFTNPELNSIRAHALTLVELAKFKPEIIPVDPDLLLAREAAAESFEAGGWLALSSLVRAGSYKPKGSIYFRVQSALIAIRKVREMEK